jgi:predicted nucleic acid-binding protein
MPPIKTIYWDSCVFIAWIKDEKRPPGEMDGIYECVGHVQKGKIRIVTSVMTRTEVFETDLTPDVSEKYANLLNRRNVQTLDQDLRVSNLAREIREFYERQSQIDHLPGLSTPDAVHLATAIHYRVEEFWTFDDGGYKSRSLLSLNGNVAGHPLVITKPMATQLRLRFSS